MNKGARIPRGRELAKAAPKAMAGARDTRRLSRGQRTSPQIRQRMSARRYGCDPRSSHGAVGGRQAPEPACGGCPRRGARVTPRRYCMCDDTQDKGQSRQTDSLFAPRPKPFLFEPLIIIALMQFDEMNTILDDFHHHAVILPHIIPLKHSMGVAVRVSHISNLAIPRNHY